MLTRAEALLASATATLAFAILVAYVPYRAGWRVLPILVLAITVAGAIATTGTLLRRSTPSPSALGALIVVAGSAFFFLTVALPDLLPVGGGPDLAHHLVLINYIERSWKLVDDPALYPYLGDMMDYTPGAHLLMALVGAWTHTAALRVVHPVLVLTVALKTGFIFSIARRLALHDTARSVTGAVAVILLFVPFQYLAGSFTTQSYWPQVVSELFACAAWWAVVVWDEREWAGALVLFTLFSAATFVTWPIWVGPISLVFVATVVMSRPSDVQSRARRLVIGLGPLALVAAAHTVGRSGRLQMVGTTGFAIQPSAATLGWLFIVVAAAGLAASPFLTKLRSTSIFACAIALQALALYGIAHARGADAPYMALKMMYIAIYPLGVAGAIVITGQRGVAWIAAAALLPVAAYRVTTTPKPKPIVTLAVWKSGLWARDHVDRACVDYLVADTYTGYWLHLAVLDNPRGTARFEEPATFDPQKAVERWVEVAGLPYAIVDDARGFSKALFNGTDTVAQFDPSIVIKRRGTSTCRTEQWSGPPAATASGETDTSVSARFPLSDIPSRDRR